MDELCNCVCYAKIVVLASSSASKTYFVWFQWPGDSLDLILMRFKDREKLRSLTSSPS